jgi:hypothetical protein
MTALLRAGTAALLLLPGALTLYLSIDAGGFFPGTYALAALIVAQVLVLRTTLAEEPGEAIRAPLLVAAAAMAGLTLWTIASQAWSDSTSRALLEGERALLYTLVLVLFGTLPRRGDHMRWLLAGVTVVMAGICIAALITAVLPEVWPTERAVANDRLSFPLTYWNALGLMGVLAIVFCLHFGSDDRLPRVVPAVATAAIPLVATTVYFTFSRGAILCGAVGIVVYLVAARSRRLLAPLLAAGPTSAVGVAFAYGADALAADDRTTAAAIAEGQDLAVVLAICAAAAFAIRLALALTGEPLRRVPVPASKRAVRTIAVACVAAFVLAGLAADAPGRVSNAVDGFVNEKEVEETGDFRDRFISPSSSFRVDHWNVALDAFRASPLRGEGAGTFQLTWNRERDVDFRVFDAHSLYFEMLSELGIVGLALLLVAIGMILWAFASRLRGPNRRLYAALLAGGVTWALHAGIDWDWEMPSITVWFFALGGAALAARHVPRPPREHVSGGTGRVALGVGWLAVAIAPVLLFFSHADLDRSTGAFLRGDCPTATRAALDSIATMSARPEPYQVLGYCDAIRGFPRLGAKAMQKAVEEDPGNWETHFGLALTLGQAGLDPRPAARRALELNPLEPFVVAYVRDLDRARTPRGWAQISTRTQESVLASGRLAISQE